ncbi:MAG: hypothetical protein KF699_09465 [Phycisphaeraceae bacterium]|nr:hypothetical protein [Phycisphaeraceae bacterium]
MRLSRTSPRGGAAVAIVIALVVLQLVVVGMVIAGSREQSLGVPRAESLRSLYAAEAGAQMAMRELAVGSDEDGDGAIGSISADGQSGTGPLLLGSRISTQLQSTGPDSGEIVARAQATRAHRQVRVAYSIPATGGSGGGAGLAAEFFALGAAPSTLASVNWNASPSAVGPIPYFNFASASSSSYRFWNSGPTTRYGVRYRGSIAIPQTGAWTFSLGSDAGSRLLIGGAQVIDHDGLHTFSAKTGTLNLAAGSHDLEVLYFEDTGNHGLTLAWQGPGVATTTTVPPSALSNGSGFAVEFPPIALADTLYIWGDNSATAASIDGFSAAAGAYGGANVLTDRLLVATNATGSQRVQMTQRARINGSLHIGPGGNPASVVVLYTDAQITGSTSSRPVAVGIHRHVDPWVTMPASSGSITYTSSQTISTNRTFQDLSVWGGNTVITINGNVTIRCTGNFQIGDGVRFELAAGASLILFVAGDVNIYKHATINFNTGDPSRCWLFMTGDDRRLQLTDQAKLVGHVRNPKGSLEMWGTGNPGSELYGTYHGRTMTMGDKARFHGDVSLHESSGGGGGNGSGGSPTITAWSLEP